MTPELDRLPPDQRAVLSLLLERGRSYSEVADLLAIPERAVRERAHAALDALASDPASAGHAAPAVEHSARSAASASAYTSRSRGSARSGTHDTSDRPGARSGSSSASSRRGGLLLLGGIVVVIVVAVLLISSGGGKGSSSTTSTKTSTTTSTAASSASKPKLDKTITLTPGEPELKATGLAYVLSEGNRRAFYVAAQGLPPSSGFFYAVWLYNSQSESTPLGKAPNVGSNGRMEGGGPLPSNAGSYSKLIITRETSTDPKEPGPIVMTGAFGLH
jgi:Anti-sigma-K factor rskA/Sigma-70, region 4